MNFPNRASKIAMVTGGTGGIGTAITKKFVNDGFHVIATHNSKKKDELSYWLQGNELSHDVITFVSLDLVNSEETSETIDN